MSFIEPPRKERSDIYGKRMEEVASDYLKLSGFKILEQNYKNKIGEIDIIALEKKSGRIVFVEVKARKGINYGYGREAVNTHKLLKIRQTASYYLKIKGKLDQPIRIDVIEIMGNQISHLIAVQWIWILVCTFRKKYDIIN